MSLSSLCLAVIKSNFHVFMSDFVSVDGKVPRWHYEFLQRRYSKELLESLRGERNLPGHYYSFLINAHMKELDFSSLRFPPAHILIQRLTEVGDTIGILKMERCIHTEEEWRKIVSLVPNIKELSLAYSNSDDTTIKAISRCAPLRSLDVKCCKNITNVALKYLYEKDGHKPNATLKHLIVVKTQVTEEGVMFSLTNFPSLKTLDHRDVAKVLYNIYVKHYSEKTLDTLPRLHLTTLTYYEEEKNSSLVEVLKAISFFCPKLSSMSLFRLTSSVAGGPTWAFSNLEEINLNGFVEIDFTVILESCGPHLKIITLECGKLLTDSLLKCPKLEDLHINEIDLKPISENLKSQWDVHRFEKMESLTFANLDKGELLESVIALVKSSPNLQSLYFSFESISAEERFVEDLCNCKCISILKYLIFYHTYITLASIEEILEHTNCLSQLEIVGCRTTFIEYWEFITSVRAVNNELKIIGSPGKSFDGDEDDSILLE